jgi:hypothetical protein
VGYTDGPLNFDVIVSSKSITVLEMSPRLGGNGIPEIIEHGIGADLITASLHFALGKDIDLPREAKVLKDCGSWVFGSGSAGVLAEIASEDEIKAIVPQVFRHVVNYDVGERVPAFTHNGNSLGYTLFDCPRQSSYQSIVDHLQRGLRLVVN